MAHASAAPVATVHKKAYPAIDPSRPELSQNGRLILIIGSTIGIGFAMAHGFAAASADTVILTGRRPAVLNQVDADLGATFPSIKFRQEKRRRERSIGH